MKNTRKRIILCGFGNVGREFVRLITERRSLVEQKYGLNLELAAVVDIGGAAVASNNPLPVEKLISHVESGGRVETFGGGYSRPGVNGRDMIKEIETDVLVETTPTNLTDGEPAHGHIMAAIEKGIDIVSANKGPLVLFYKDIFTHARLNGSRISMSAAALPTLDIGLLCLAGAKVISIEGVLNGTTNYILTRMHFEKCTYQTALKAAQEMGIAETDPTLDVEGFDTRNKLLIIVNQIFEKNFKLDEIPTKGISKTTPNDIDRAVEAGKVLKLVGTGHCENGQIKLTVKPRQLESDHPLAGIHYSEKGISYLTDTMGRITVTGGKSSPVGAAAALLKDLIHLSLFE